MQATVYFLKNDVESEAPHSHVNHRIGWFFKVGRRVRTLLPALLICLPVPSGGATSVAQTMAHPTNVAAQSDAQKAFEKLKTLAGTWQGSLMGMTINVTLRVTSTGNAILHEATSTARPDNPITMFYLDGDRLFATHYCDSGNRPRMEGKMSADGKRIEFTLVDIAGNTQKGYMGNVVFNFIDAGHHSEDGAWMFPGNKPPFQIHLDYTRTK